MRERKLLILSRDKSPSRAYTPEKTSIIPNIFLVASGETALDTHAPTRQPQMPTEARMKMTRGRSLRERILKINAAPAEMAKNKRFAARASGCVACEVEIR